MNPTEQYRRITVPQAHYLKHTAMVEADAKVSFPIYDGKPYISIRKMIFKNFESALRYVRHIVETEIISEARP